MTVQELYDKLGEYIRIGHADTDVIANCAFTVNKGNGYYDNFPLINCNDVYYQSGDIEIDFSDGSEEE